MIKIKYLIFLFLAFLKGDDIEIIEAHQKLYLSRFEVLKNGLAKTLERSVDGLITSGNRVQSYEDCIRAEDQIQDRLHELYANSSSKLSKLEEII